MGPQPLRFYKAPLICLNKLECAQEPRGLWQPEVPVQQLEETPCALHTALSLPGIGPDLPRAPPPQKKAKKYKSL